MTVELTGTKFQPRSARSLTQSLSRVTDVWSVDLKPAHGLDMQHKRKTLFGTMRSKRLRETHNRKASSQPRTYINLGKNKAPCNTTEVERASQSCCTRNIDCRSSLTQGLTCILVRGIGHTMQSTFLNHQGCTAIRRQPPTLGEEPKTRPDPEPLMHRVSLSV